jgi:tRNA threonylcarbamoyladenosine biosynthesis protein TsaB
MILAIETSAREASLAVRNPADGTIVFESRFVTDRAHNAAIFDPVREIVSRYRGELSGIVVGLGPGSYGGVRVGIAVANGLSVAMEIPARGVSSLVCWESDSTSYVVVGDARRGSFYLAEIVEGNLRGEPDLVDAGTINDSLASARERGLSIHTSDPTVVAAVPDARLSYPSAARVARAFDDASAGVLEPHYLRAPYITVPKNKG